MPKKHRTDLTAGFVRQIFDYDPLTGVFRWRMRPDYPRKWNSRYAGKVAGMTSPNGYVVIQAKGRVAYSAHRLAWLYMKGEWPDGEIDHRNGIRDDNRIDNLRDATESDNACNKGMQRNNTSGFIGVSFNRQNGKWRARIHRNHVMHDVGFFNTAEEAAQARAKFVREIQGKFAPGAEERRRYKHHRDG